MQSAQDFYGDSLGRVKGQLQNDRAQLESLMEQSPPEAQAQLQEMIDSYTEIEGTLDQAAHDQGLDDVVNDAAQQAQDALGQVTDQAGQAAQGVQDTAGQAAGQAQEAAGQAVGQVTEAAGQATQGVQDAAGGAVQQAQDAAGGATEQAQGAAGQVADQAGQAAQGAQDAAGQAAQQAQDTAGQDLNITDAARQKAEELGVDLSQVEGTGAEGRITVKDVTSAANQ
jgi:pyruvate/2-oxoglutarate dehydrogenase complex dihydrolipoamide acyltransferase (E2) component